MDERRRHFLSGQNQPGMEYDSNQRLQHEDMNYMDQILQRDRNEGFMDRTTQPSAAYGSHRGASYFRNHGDQGQPYSNWQSQARNPSHLPSMYIPQTYPNYPSGDQSRFISSQTVGHLPHSGYERYGNAVDRTPSHASQSLPSDRSTADIRQSSWNKDEMYRNDVGSREATAQESRSCLSTYGTLISNTDLVPSRIPQGSLANSHSTSSRMPVNDKSIKDPYNTATNTEILPMNYEASHVTPGLESQLDSSNSEAFMPSASTQKHSTDIHQSKNEPPVNVPLPESTNNSVDDSCPLLALSQQDKAVSDVNCKDHELFRTADSRDTRQTTEETHCNSEHSFHSVNDKLALSSTQHTVQTCDANSVHVENVVEQNFLKTKCIVTGEDRREHSWTSVSKESLDHIQPKKKKETKQDNSHLPVNSEPVGGKTLGTENRSTASESQQNTKMETEEDNVNRSLELDGIKNASSDSSAPSNTYVDRHGERQEFHIEHKSQQSKEFPKENHDDHFNGASASVHTHTTVRTTVDLSAAEQGCSTVVKFEDGTCKYIKGEPTSEKEEDTFYCSSQQDDGQVVLEPKKVSSEENNPTGIQEEDKVPIVKQEIEEDKVPVVKQEIKEDKVPIVKQEIEEDKVPIVKPEVKEDQKLLGDDDAIELKLEVEEESGSSTGISRGVSDESRHGAVPLKAQDGNPFIGHLECNYDSDGWQLGSNKQNVDNSSKISTAHGGDDEGMFDRCPKCNELVASNDMIEHPFKCKAKSNTCETPVDLPIVLQPPNDDEAEQKCPECGVGFQTTDDLVIHLRIHEMLAKNARKMQEENQMMVMAEEMEKQMTDFPDITEETSEECEVCYETFTDPTMIPYHNMMHQQFPFHCRKCNLFFNTLTELHKSRCSDQKRHKVFKYRCKKCKGALLDSYKMRKHRKRCEGKMETCRLCQKKFPSFKQLAHHAEICNEDQMKKGGEEGMDCNEADIIMEATVLENEDADHEAVVDSDALDSDAPDYKAVNNKDTDQAAVDHGYRVHEGTDQTADHCTTADRRAADHKPADQNAADHGSSVEIELDSRPVKAEIRELRGQAEEFAHGDDRKRPPKNAIETDEMSQPSFEDSSVVRCKVCERELPTSRRYHGRVCKISSEYCKACLNMIRTEHLPPHDNSAASKNCSLHKRTLPTGSSSSYEETYENAGREPSKKKHKEEQTNGETCGACGKWFKNFEKLAKHAARCDGVRDKHDKGACPEEQPNEEINLDWKYPKVHRCPKCNKKFVKKKKLKKHVKSCLWIQEGSPAESCEDSSAPVDDVQSRHEDELLLSTVKNVNTFSEDSSGREDAPDIVDPDTVDHKPGTYLVDSMKSSSENSKVELMSGPLATLDKKDKGESTQSISDIPKKSAEEAREQVCVTNGSLPSHENKISITEPRITLDRATHERNNIGASYNLISASGVSEKHMPVESGYDVDKQHTESIEQVQEMDTSHGLNCDEGTKKNFDPSVASAQVTLGGSETDTSTFQLAMAVPAQDESVSISTSLDTVSQEHLSHGNESGTLLRENLTPSCSFSDNNRRKNAMSFTQAEHKMERVQEIDNTKIGLSSPLASSLPSGVEVKEDQPLVGKSTSLCPEINKKETTNQGEQIERMVCHRGGKDPEPCSMDEGIVKPAEPEQVLEVVDKAKSQVEEAAEQLPGQSTGDENTRGLVAQARPTTTPTHQEPAQTVSFQDSTMNATQAAVEAIKEESSMEVEYAMSLETIKTITLECDAIPGHHCVYCAAEFPSRSDLWKHARDCRDNHLMVIASRVSGKKEYRLVEKPVSCGSVPWQVLNDYTKKEAMVMKTDMGIDLNCVVPAVGYRPPPNKPEPEPIKNKKRKKKKKSKVKEDIEKEKKRKIERKKRKVRERQREKLRVQAKLQQLEQNNVKKFKDKEKQKTYTCELCNRSFHSREKFEKHKVGHVSTPHKKTLAVCVEKLKVEEIEDHKKFKSTSKHPAMAKSKEKELSKKKYSKVAENQSVPKKKTIKKRPPGKKEKEHLYIDVESIDESDKIIAKAHTKKNSSRETLQSIVKPSNSVPTTGSLGTVSESMEGIQEADTGSSHVKSKGTTWKKNEFGVQFPVVIEVECPDCQMKFSHQSTLDRHRRLHRK